MKSLLAKNNNQIFLYWKISKFSSIFIPNLNTSWLSIYILPTHWTAMPLLKLKHKHKTFSLKLLNTPMATLILANRFSHLVLFWNNFFVFRMKSISSWSTFLFSFPSYASYSMFQSMFRNLKLWNLFTQSGVKQLASPITWKLGKISSFKTFKSQIF